MNQMDQSLDSLNKKMKGLGVTTEEASKKSRKAIEEWSKSIHNFDDEVEDLGSSLRKTMKEVKGLSVAKTFNLKQASDYINRIDQLTSKLKDLKKMDFKDGVEGLEQQVSLINEYKQEVKSLTDQITASSKDRIAAFEDMGEGIGQVLNVFKSFGSLKGLRNQASSAKDLGDYITGWSGSLGAAGKKMGMLGEVTKKVGSAVGGIGKLFGGWVGVLAVVGKKIWDMGMAADAFVKDANKRFAEIRGPDIITKDIRGQFKEFNNMVYDAGKNLEVGLNADQIREFMNAVYQAGTNIGRLNEGLLGYRDSIHIAARASKVLAMDLPQVGSIISELMNNFRMDMRTIDKSFVQVAFSAKKSGMSSDRFWNAVQNASASLAFYGIYVEQATKQLEKFSKTGVMGVEETSKTVEDLTQSFKNMSDTQRASFLGLVKSTDGGREAVNAAFKSFESEWRSKLTDVEAQITSNLNIKDRDEGTEAEYNRLLNEQANIQSKIAMASEAQEKNDVEQAPYLPLIADRASELITRLLQLRGSNKSLADMTGEEIWTSKKILETMGLNTDFAMQLKQLATHQNNMIEKQVGISGTAEQKKISFLGQIADINTKQLQKTKFDNLIDAFRTQDPQKIADAQKELADHFEKDLKFSEETSKFLADISSVDPEIAKSIYDLIKTNENTSDEEINNFIKLIKDNKAADKMVAKTERDANKTADAQEKQAEDTFKEIRDQTLSFEEMIKIAKDEWKWRLSSLKLATALNKQVLDIYGWLVKDDSGYISTSQKEAQNKVKAFASSKFGINLGDSNITEKEQKFLTKQTVKRLDALDATIKAVEQFKSAAAEGKDLSAMAEDDKKHIENISKNADENTRAFIAISKKLDEEKNRLADLTASGTNNSQDVIDAQKKTVNELSAKYDQMIGSSESDMSGIILRLERFKLLEKAVKQGKESAKKDADEVLSEAESQTNNLENNLINLKDISKTNDTMALYLKGLLMGNKEARDQAARDFADMINSEEDAKKVMEEYGLKPEELSGMLKDVGEKNKIKYVKVMQGLKTPYEITEPSEMILAHKGETVLPVSGSGTVPTIPAIAAGGAGATSSSKTININVNATEKDLAQKIANQIRATMYQEQLTGMS